MRTRQTVKQRISTRAHKMSKVTKPGINKSVSLGFVNEKAPKMAKTKAITRASLKKKTLVVGEPASMKMSKFKGYTEAQYRMFWKFYRHFQKTPTNELHHMLKYNNMKAFGSNKEMAWRCADAQVLGAIPRCTRCKGKLRFDSENGLYWCPGFYAPEYKMVLTCGKKFSMGEVSRKRWKKLPASYDVTK